MKIKIIIASLALLAVGSVAGAMFLGQTQKVAAHDATQAGETSLSLFRHKANHQDMLEIKAKVLGMTVEELQEALDSGMNFIEIAESRGLTYDDLIEQMRNMRNQWLDTRVESGFLTQEQADQIREKSKERYQQMIEDGSYFRSMKKGMMMGAMVHGNF